MVSALSELANGRVVRRRLAREQRRQLSWIEIGSAGPTVVLVAGAGEVALDWAVILPQLSERHRVIAYDRAGLGASDRRPRLTLESQVQDLTALLDVVGPAVLVGHSWGGLLAELATRARPDRARGLLLVDPFHEEMTAAVPLALRVASSLVLSGIVLMKAVGLFSRTAKRMGRRLAERCTDDPNVRAHLVDAYVASYSTIAQVATIRDENRLADRSSHAIRTARRESSAPDIPMRILTAAAGKPSALQQLTGELGQRTANAHLRGEHVHIPDSGHYIHHDQPGTVLASIQALADAAAQDHGTDI
ncbi:alpha/beta hydrolase [Actinoplanes sichuanensis]|nr:alpha/beta hydrolase [Actinoplanes sichuanensis]